MIAVFKLVFKRRKDARGLLLSSLQDIESYYIKNMAPPLILK